MDQTQKDLDTPIIGIYSARDLYDIYKLNEKYGEAQRMEVVKKRLAEYGYSISDFENN